MATWTTPKTWGVGDALTANDLNTYVSDNLTHLKDNMGIGARVYNSANISIPSGVATVLTFDSERFDPDDIHSTTANTSRLTCQKAGVYLIVANAAWTAAPTLANIRINLNGTTIIAITNSVGDYRNMAIATLYKLAVGDYVEALASQSSGGTMYINSIGDYSPEFGMQWIGEG